MQTPRPQGRVQWRAPGLLSVTPGSPRQGCPPGTAAQSRHPVPSQGHHRQANRDSSEALGAGAEFHPASVPVLAGALFHLISAAAACAAPITRAWPQGWGRVWGRCSDPDALNGSGHAAASCGGLRMGTPPAPPAPSKDGVFLEKTLENSENKQNYLQKP